MGWIANCHNQKEIAKRTKCNLNDPTYCKRPSKQTWSRPRPDLQGAVSDACYVEQRSFRGGMSLWRRPPVSWTIRESSAVKIGAPRGRVFLLFEERRQLWCNEGESRKVGGETGVRAGKRPGVQDEDDWSLRDLSGRRGLQLRDKLGDAACAARFRGRHIYRPHNTFSLTSH